MRQAVDCKVYVCCRPYLYTTIVSAVVTVPFLLIKASIFDWPSYHPPAIFLFLHFLGFSLLHILVARKVVGWTRNRYKLGLLGQSYPWQVSGHATLVLALCWLQQWQGA